MRKKKEYKEYGRWRVRMKAVITTIQLDVIFYERHCPNRMSFFFTFCYHYLLVVPLPL